MYWETKQDFISLETCREDKTWADITPSEAGKNVVIEKGHPLLQEEEDESGVNKEQHRGSVDCGGKWELEFSLLALTGGHVHGHDPETQVFV